MKVLFTVEVDAEKCPHEVGAHLEQEFFVDGSLNHDIEKEFDQKKLELPPPGSRSEWHKTIKPLPDITEIEMDAIWHRGERDGILATNHHCLPHRE